MKKIIVQGNIVEYQEIGSGHPILFMHGAFSSGHTWRKVIPKLSAHFRCIIPELPFGGHREAISTDIDFTPLGIADFILAILEALKVDKVMVIANDTGGAYAQVFISKYAHKVSHLVLSNCEGFEIFPPKKFSSLQTMVHVPGYLWLMSKLFAYKPSLKWDMTFGLLSHTLGKDDIYDYYVKNFSENRLIRNDFKKLASEWHPKYTQNAAKELANFKKPVLILWGMDDKELFPVSLGKRLAALFENATFVEISNSLTYIQEDKPNEFTREIMKFLKENELSK